MIHKFKRGSSISPMYPPHQTYLQQLGRARVEGTFIILGSAQSLGLNMFLQKISLCTYLLILTYWTFMSRSFLHLSSNNNNISSGALASLEVPYRPHLFRWTTRIRRVSSIIWRRTETPKFGCSLRFLTWRKRNDAREQIIWVLMEDFTVGKSFQGHS